MCDLRRFNYLYTSQNFGGTGGILRKYLGLTDDFILPFTFPHGVDTGVDAVPCDVRRLEPVYVGFRPDVAEAARRFKPAIVFPHPWLMLEPAEPRRAKPAGTLFVAPSSSPQNNQRFHDAIRDSALPKPWGMMVKFRAVDQDDFEWWSKRGFATHSAGSPDSAEFFPRQREALSAYEVVATPYLSTLAVFAAHMGKRVVPITDVSLLWVTGPDYDNIYLDHDRSAVAGPIWERLCSDDETVRKAEADRLLGVPSLKPRAEMIAVLEEAIGSIERPVYLDGVRSPLARMAIEKALALGLPADRLARGPLHAVVRKLTHLAGVNRLGIMEGNEFRHHGIGSKREPFAFYLVRGHQVGMGAGLGDGPKKIVREPASETVQVK